MLIKICLKTLLIALQTIQIKQDIIMYKITIVHLTIIQIISAKTIMQFRIIRVS